MSKGKFKELCIRFSDDFNHSLDDWKPDRSDPTLMNLCFVSEGSYEICSHTEKAVKDENAKWLLNIKWQMTGVDVHVDTNIGKHLSALGHTLTTLTGREEEDKTTESNSVSEEDDFDLSSSDDLNVLRRQKTQQLDLDLPSYLFDPNLDKQEKAKCLEHEINEQAKTVEDLQKLGASEQTVSLEIRKLEVMQNIASKNFRQDLAEKLKRQKSKASYIKEKLGLGSGSGASSSSAHHRLGAKSKSVCIPSPTLEEKEFQIPEGQQRKLSQSFKLSFDEDLMTTELSEELALPPQPPPQRKVPVISRTSTIEEEEELSFDGEFQPGNNKNTKSPGLSRDSSSSLKKFNLSPKTSNNSSSSGERPTTNPSNITMGNLKAQEPNVDFEFQINILINSGKCVLHTVKEEEKRRMKKDRSFSGNIFDSPNLSRKGVKGSSDFKTVHSSTRLRDMRPLPTQDITTFHIPGTKKKKLLNMFPADFALFNFLKSFSAILLHSILYFLL